MQQMTVSAVGPYCQHYAEQMHTQTFAHCQLRTPLPPNRNTYEDISGCQRTRKLLKRTQKQR